MKEYTVEVEITAWAKITVVARNGEEAIDAACDMVDLDDAYDWEIEEAEVV
nr:MAG TPA: RNA polymerase inhibitor [Caudoviricetes sp.]